MYKILDRKFLRKKRTAILRYSLFMCRVDCSLMSRIGLRLGGKPAHETQLPTTSTFINLSACCQSSFSLIFPQSVNYLTTIWQPSCQLLYLSTRRCCHPSVISQPSFSTVFKTSLNQVPSVCYQYTICQLSFICMVSAICQPSVNHLPWVIRGPSVNYLLLRFSNISKPSLKHLSTQPCIIICYSK